MPPPNLPGNMSTFGNTVKSTRGMDFTALIKAIENNTKAISQGANVQTSIDESFRKNNKNYLAWITLGTSLYQILSDVDDILIKSYSINKDINEALLESADSMAALPGGITPLIAGLDFTKTGLSNVGINLTRLYTRLKLTGQSTESLINLSKMLISGGNLTRLQLDNLAGILEDTAYTYGIQNDVLNESLLSLEGSIRSTRYFGVQSPFVEAVSKLTASYSETFAPEVNRLVNALLDDSPQAMQNAMILGVEDLRRQLLQTASADEQLRILTRIIDLAGRRTEELSRSFISLGPRGLAPLREMVGTMGEASIGLSKAMRDGFGVQKDLKTAIENYDKSFNALKEEFLAPFKEWGLKIMPEIYGFLKDNMKPIQILIPAIVSLISISRVFAKAISIGPWGRALNVLVAIGGILSTIAGIQSSAAKDTKKLAEIAEKDQKSNIKTIDETLQNNMREIQENMFKASDKALILENEKWLAQMRLLEKIAKNSEETRDGVFGVKANTTKTMRDGK